MHDKVMEIYLAGLANGTWKNKSVQAKKYLQFAKLHQFDPLEPAQYDLLAYTNSLNETLKAPGTVMNYISGARSWVLLFGGNTSPFDSYPLTLMKRGVLRLSQHIPRQAPPLSPSSIRAVVRHLITAGPDAAVLVAAILVGYSTLLRQGNLLNSHDPQDPGHALQRGDIITTRKGLTVTVRSTKTRWRPGQSYTVLITPRPHSICCPVTAWRRYIRLQAPPRSGPAFTLPTGGPLTPPTLLAALRLALTATGHHAPYNYSLHSLRRGGAQACAASGGSLQEIMALGSWTSAAVHTYVPRDQIRCRPLTLP